LAQGLTDVSTRSIAKSLLRGIAGLLFVVAALAFWFRGRVIHGFAKREQVLAELEGVGLAAAFGLLGWTGKTAGDHLDRL
jgi:hypothetical protein